MLVASHPRRVAIVGGVRTPFARSHTAFAGTDNQELLTASLRALVERYGLVGERLGDVMAGAVLKHSRDFNLTRECVLSTGLDPQTPGLDLQRACGTSLEAAILVANKIALGQIEAGIAAGVDDLSDPPVVFPKSFRRLRPQPPAAAAALARAAAPRPAAGAARRERAPHRPVDGPELRADGQDLADRAGRAGPAGQ
jgi:acetyl-CoA C-acetyltransferase